MKKLFLLIFVSVIMTIPISIVCADSGYHSPSAVISEMGESYQIIEEKIQIASETEPLYTYEEILSIPDDHFPNASVEEVALIKKNDHRCFIDWSFQSGNPTIHGVYRSE